MSRSAAVTGRYFVQRLARVGEWPLAPVTRWLVTRIVVVLEKPA